MADLYGFAVDERDPHVQHGVENGPGSPRNEARADGPHHPVSTIIRATPPPRTKHPERAQCRAEGEDPAAGPARSARPGQRGHRVHNRPARWFSLPKDVPCLPPLHQALIGRVTSSRPAGSGWLTSASAWSAMAPLPMTTRSEPVQRSDPAPGGKGGVSRPAGARHLLEGDHAAVAHRQPKRSVAKVPVVGRLVDISGELRVGNAAPPDAAAHAFALQQDLNASPDRQAPKPRVVIAERVS